MREGIDGRFNLSLTLVILLISSILLPMGELIAENKETETFSSPKDPPNVFQDIAFPDGFNQTNYLDYSDVGVLINNKSAESRTIGWAFVSARNISLEHVFLFDMDDTPTGETISRAQFNTYFADPFAVWIGSENRSNDLNYLVTSKGVPLRISGDGKASFDSEIGLIGGVYDIDVGDNWWTTHAYGPLAGKEMESFSRSKYGFSLVTRLTGYSVDTALGLIDKANSSLGQRGQFVLDLATNRNGSGYKYWNDDLYAANTSLNGSLGLPVTFNQNSTFLTNQSNVIGYASWGSNDGAWNENLLPNSGFDTSDSSWETGSRYWNSSDPTLTNDEDFSWARQTAVKRNGNAAIEGVLSQSQSACTSGLATTTNGVFAEYFDNNGISFNTSQMPDLTGRNADYSRVESTIDHPTTTNVWSGLDSSRFSDYFSARYTAILEIPEDGNWTFYLGADDGGIFDLNGTRFIDNQGIHPYQEVSNSTILTSGLYQINVEMFEQGGWAGVGLSWAGPNITKQIIPSSFLTLALPISVEEQELVNYWSFDDGNGTTITDEKNGNNLTIYGGGAGTNWSNGIDIGAYNFNGVDEYAKVEVDDWNGDFSVSLWVYTDNATQDLHSSIFAVNNMAGDGSSFQIETDANGNWQVWHNSTYSFGTVDAGEWTHLAVTYSESNILSLYKNGELVRTENLSNDTIDNIELYKIGVNRAGDTYFSGMIDELKIWNSTLSDSDIADSKNEIIWQCPQFSGIGSAQASVEQVFQIEEELRGHVWNVWAYAQRDGWINANWGMQVDAYSDNGTLLSTNVSTGRHLTGTWEQDYFRFRPHQNATSFTVRLFADFIQMTHNGSIFFDTVTLRAIRPHMEWINGSIVETAVSTGGRSFNTGTTYGQSLVADILEDGASATKGYVYEPYLTAVSYPSILLPSYAEGYTMAESYYAANTMISWMGVVVGDPKMAAYSDLLHDVSIESASANGTLTEGHLGSISTIVENLAPGPANGTIEIRDKQGNILVGSINLTLPPGDQLGSRIMIDLPITPTRNGYVEYDIRWKNSSEGGFPERIKDNNAISLNILINQIPLVTDGWCASSQIERGDTFACFATSTDDDSVGEMWIGWRLSNSSLNQSEWTWSQTSHNTAMQWWTVFDAPVNISLGMIDLAVIAIDNANFSSLMVLFENASEFVNAVPRWYGLHIETVDDPQWDGTSDLPYIPQNGLLRGRQVLIRACTIDADHDPISEWPQFAASKGVVGSVSNESQFENGVYCYRSTWILPIGGDLQSAQLELWSNGELRNGRSIIVADLAPVPTISMRNSENNTIEFSSGSNEYVWLSVMDGDDPNSAITGDLLVSWPGMLTSTLPISIPANTDGVFIELPAAEAGLEIGNLQVEFSISGAHGATNRVTEIIPVILTLPSILEIKICNSNGTIEELTKNEPAALYIYLQSTRDVDQYRIDIEQTGWASESPLLDLQSPPWDENPPIGCEGNSSIVDSASQIMKFRLFVGNSYTGGQALIRIRIADLDGLSISQNVPISIAHSPPEIEIFSQRDILLGEPLDVSIIVSDADGLAGVRCEIFFTDSNGIQHSQANGQPDISGEINIIHQTKDYNQNESISISASCRDESGNLANSTMNNPVQLLFTEEEEGSIPTDTKGDGDTGKWFAILSFGLLFSILFAVGLWYNKRQTAINIEHADESQTKAWIELEDEASADEEYSSSDEQIETDSGEIDATLAPPPIQDSIPDSQTAQLAAPPIASKVVEEEISQIFSQDESIEVDESRESEVSEESEAQFQAQYLAQNSPQNDLDEIIDDLL